MGILVQRAAIISAVTGALLTPRALFAAHPQITEDTGTQGRGKFQLEHNNERGYKEEGTSETVRSAVSTTLSYGVTGNVDAIFTFPSVRNKTSDAGAIVTDDGHGDNGYDVKWRFHESGRRSFALKAGVTTPNGDEKMGRGTGKTTYSTYFVTTMQESLWSWNVHLGRVGNRNSLGDRDELWHASVGGWRQIGEKFKLLVDTGRLTNTDATAPRCLGFVTVGVIYSPVADFDIDLGVKKGLTRSEVDYAWLAGLTFRF